MTIDLLPKDIKSQDSAPTSFVSKWTLKTNKPATRFSRPTSTYNLVSRTRGMTSSRSYWTKKWSPSSTSSQIHRPLDRLSLTRRACTPATIPPQTTIPKARDITKVESRVTSREALSSHLTSMINTLEVVLASSAPKHTSTNNELEMSAYLIGRTKINHPQL